MEKKGIKAFEAALKADETLHQKYEEALKGVTEAASDGEAMQKAAAELGYEITLEELEQAWAAGQELDESELASVAGGQSDHSNWCLANWFCYTVAKHTDVPDEEGPGNYQCTKEWLESSHTESCWSNYWCVIWNN